MISAFVLPDIAYAHASTKLRSRCSWWKNRYKASARVTDLGIIPLCLQSDGSCSSASVSCDKNCGIAEAIRSATTNFIRAESFPSGGLICGAGEGQTMLSKLITTNSFPILEDDVSILSKLTYQDDLNEAERIYRIFGMKGKLSIPKNYPGIVELRITLWEAQDDEVNFIEDTSMTEEKTFDLQYIRIRNNKVELSEEFRNNPAVKITENDRYISVSFEGMEFNYNIPDFVDIEKEFASDLSAYSDPDNERIVREASSDVAKFNIYPNPNNGQFTLSKLIYAVPSIKEIQVFNAQGVLVRTLNKSLVNGMNKAFSNQIFLPNLPFGTYYLAIQGDAIFEVKRIVIQSSN